MKKNLTRKVTLSILTGAVLMSSSVVWAAPTGWTEVSGVGYVRDSSNDYGTVPNGTYENAIFYGAYVNDNIAKDGKVTITNSTISGVVYGGCTFSGNATSNAVTITGSTISFIGMFPEAVYGGCTFSGNATSNAVTVTGGSIKGEVSGGYTDDNGAATENTVTINGGTFDGSIYGGYAYSGNADDNTVTISDGTFNGDYIYGGLAYGAATENNVTINGGTFDSSIYGGYAYSGNADDNTVTISDGTFNCDIYGGNGYDGAEGNAVNIEGGMFADSIYGGYSSVAAEGNAVKINFTDGGTFNGDYIYGGCAYGAAIGNTVEINITDGTFNGDCIYGGYACGAAIENTVNITLGDFESEIYGGYSEEANVTENTVNIKDGIFYSDIYGGRSGDGTASKNIVDIEAGTFNDEYVVGGGYSEEANVTENMVNIKAGTFDGYVVGGRSGGGTATGNAVNIKAGTFDGYVVGGDAFGAATGNAVNIEGGTFNGDYIYGGYAYGAATGNAVNITDGTFNGDYIYGGYSEEADVTENTVNITGGTFNVSVVGGWANDGDNGEVTSNTVNISGNANLEKASLYGGFGASVSSNTLNIGTADTAWANLHKTSSGNNINAIERFDTINFEHVKWDTTNPAIKVNELVLSDEGTIITVNNLYVEEGDATFVANANMTLIDSDDTGGKIADDSSVVTIHSGIANVYAADIVMGDEIEGADAKDVFIVLDGEGTKHENVGNEVYPSDDSTGGDNTGGDDAGDDDNTGGDNNNGDNNGDNTGGESGGTTPQPSRNDQVLVLGESRAAAVAFTNQGSELIETGLNALARDNEKDTKVFAAVYGNHSEYETGSHVNVNGWSGIVGIGKTNANGLTVGAFFENGEGNYSTHNIFTNDYIRGDGEACYNGGGFLVRKDNANGVYTEASLRAGNLQNELRNAVRNGNELTGYDIDTFYYGAHVGVGKVIARGNDGDSIDVYGKFIYTHHDGETFDIGGTATKFDSVESERLRLGFRINEVQTNKLSMYYGAAWEYEFNGDAHDKIASFDLETPSLGGSTVIGEIGAHYKASEKWSIDLNGRAYVGQREGFSGSVQANYAF